MRLRHRTPQLAYLLTLLAAALQACSATDSPRGDIAPEPRVAQIALPDLSEAMWQQAPALVVVLVDIDDSGRLTNANIETSTNTAFDAAALATVGRYKFEPAEEDGKPVAGQLRVPIAFELKDPKQPTALKPVAKPGETSPGNPYVGTKLNVNGQTRDGQQAFSVTHDSGKIISQLTLTGSDRHLIMKDGRGNILFNGPVNTTDQQSRLTQDQRYILERLNQAVVINTK